MKPNGKMSDILFFLTCLACGVILALSLAAYFGEPDYPTAVLVAVAAVFGATMAKQVAMALIKRWCKQ